MLVIKQGVLSMAEIRLADFQLSRITVEVRYPAAYQLWDNAGAIWQQVSQHWPDIKVSETSPNNQKFMHKKEFYCETQLEKSFLIQYEPKSDLSDVIENADFFLQRVNKNLGLTHYSRIGARFIYYMKCKDRDEASRKIIETGVIKFPIGKHFNIEGVNIDPEYAIRLENKEEKNGIYARIKAVSEKTKIDAGINIREFETVELERHGIYYDLDYYISIPTNISSLRIKEWLGQAHQIIKRDSKNFLGG
jgi:hypothetical protein